MASLDRRSAGFSLSDEDSVLSDDAPSPTRSTREMFARSSPPPAGAGEMEESVYARRPFVMPEPALADRTPTVQFAAGMSLGSGGDDLLVSYSVRDCGARVARVRLDEVLRDVGLEW